MAVNVGVIVIVRVTVGLVVTVGVFVGEPHWFRLPETVPVKPCGTLMAVSPPVAQIRLLMIWVMGLPAPWST